MKRIIAITLMSLSLLYSQDLTGIRICVDPGHGGTESDDRPNPTVGFFESASNFTKGLELQNVLRGLGATVKMTRPGNYDPPPTDGHGTINDPSLSERVAIANAFVSDYFQSIHSNGGVGSLNFTLILFQGGDNTPTYAGSKVMADILVGKIRVANRTGYHSNAVRGDFDFYGTGRAYLGVFKGLNMFATLTEGSFHDYRAETWRLMNLDYRKNEARAIVRSIIEYYSQPGFATGSLAGIVRDPNEGSGWVAFSGTGDQHKPIDEVQITINPGNHIYTGDLKKNGYFCVDSLDPGSYTVIAEATDYNSDTSVVTISANKTNFSDFYLTSNAPPAIILSSPAVGDTIFPSWNVLRFKFNHAMNTPSVDSVFSITPHHSGTIDWSQDQKIMSFTPDDILAFVTEYTIEIGGSAVDIYDHPLDGNGDGIGGDAWTLQFKTGRQDMDPPQVIETYPVQYQTNVDLRPLITVVYNEMVTTESFSSDKFSIEHLYNGEVINTSTTMDYVGMNSVISVFALEDLPRLDNYRLKILSGLQDESGNTISNTRYISFTTSSKHYDYVGIENFEGAFTSYWWEPDGSGSTAGINTDSTKRFVETDQLTLNTGSSQSMKLKYEWDPNAGTWLLREYLSGSSPRSVIFDDTYTLQAFVYGDGQGNKIRFAVDDANWAGHEVSPWQTIDWYGWRLVSWDMSKDGTGLWLDTANGILDGSLRIDSFQFTHEVGAGIAGTYYIDDLRLTKESTVSVESQDDQLPKEYALLQNYPNPFNPMTNIPFTVPERVDVRINIYNLRGELVEHVFRGQVEAGKHITRWDASSTASGVYLVAMESNNTVVTQKITVLK